MLGVESLTGVGLVPAGMPASALHDACEHAGGCPAFTNPCPPHQPPCHPCRSTPQPGSTAEALQKVLLLSGFPGATAAPGGGVAATKPSWATGAKAAIALKPRSQQQQQPAAATWTLAGDGAFRSNCRGEGGNCSCGSMAPRVAHAWALPDRMAAARIAIWILICR